MILMVLGGFGILFGVDLIAYRHAEGIRDLGLGDALPVVAGAAMAAGALQVGAGVLILRLSHVGRVLGLSLATFFLLAGIATLPSQEATAGVGLVLNGLVVYALLAYRHVFRRRTSG
jgi:hypothetical protein